MKTRTILAFTMMLAASFAGASLSQGAGRDAEAPVLGGAAPSAIAGRYLVVFRPSAVDHDVTAAASAAARLGGKVH